MNLIGPDGLAQAPPWKVGMSRDPDQCGFFADARSIRITATTSQARCRKSTTNRLFTVRL